MVKEAKLNIEKYSGINRTNLENFLDEEIKGIDRDISDFIMCPVFSCSDLGIFSKCYGKRYLNCKKYKQWGKR